MSLNLLLAAITSVISVTPAVSVTPVVPVTSVRVTIAADTATIAVATISVAVSSVDGRRADTTVGAASHDNILDV